MPLKTDDYSKLLDLEIEMRDKFPMLKRSLILWKHYLAFSGMVDENDTWTLYDYITHPETGKMDDGLISQVKDKGHVNFLL
jgi:hypothetical protein